jgi:hypothetical protein
MAMKVGRMDVWAASIQDRPGALAEKLTALAEAGANLSFVIARRTTGKRGGGGVVFVTPLKGAKQLAAAKKAKFRKTRSLHGLQVEAPDKPGLGAKITQALADAGINLRGLSAAAIGRRCVVYIALDKPADLAKATRTLKKL